MHSCSDVIFITANNQASHGIISSNFVSLMDAQTYGLIFADVEFDVDLFIVIVCEGNLYLGDNWGQWVIFYDEKHLDLFFKLLLIQEEVSWWRVFSSDLHQALQQLFRDVFKLKKSSKIELSARISEIVVYFSIQLKNFHQVVVFSSRKTNFMFRFQFRSHNGSTIGTIQQRLDEMLFNKLFVFCG